MRRAALSTLLAALALCAGTAALAQSGAASAGPGGDTLVVKRETLLRKEPAASDPGTVKLPVNAVVQRTGEREGVWVRVRSGLDLTGWVHLFDLTSAAASPAGSNAGVGALRGLTSALGGANATSSTVPTATVGIRGLDASDIANAQPNPGAVKQAESLAVSATEAQRFAAQALPRPLLAQVVADLPKPPPPPPENASGVR